MLFLLATGFFGLSGVDGDKKVYKVNEIKAACKLYENQFQTCRYRLEKKAVPMDVMISHLGWLYDLKQHSGVTAEVLRAKYRLRTARPLMKLHYEISDYCLRYENAFMEGMRRSLD